MFHREANDEENVCTFWSGLVHTEGECVYPKEKCFCVEGESATSKGLTLVSANGHTVSKLRTQLCTVIKPIPVTESNTYISTCVFVCRLALLCA